MLPNVLQTSATDHVPVLAGEVRELLAVRPGETVVDATFGAGGHAVLLAADLQGKGKLIAIDRDPEARAYFDRVAKQVAAQTRFLRGDFSVVLEQLADNGVEADAILLEEVARPPVLVSIGGSDLWKDTVAIQSRAFLRFGIAVLALDKPGTGDAPLPVRPGAERIYSAVIDHVATRPDLDGTRIVVRGQSWGSYWAARTGYAEARRLKGVVFQSGPVHHYFQPDWQRAAFKTKEFLFDYLPSRLHLLGQKGEALGQLYALAVTGSDDQYRLVANTSGNKCTDGKLFFDTNATGAFVVNGQGDYDLVYFLGFA
jgi:hypothetical protein